MRLFSEGMMQHMKIIQELRNLVKALEKIAENILFHTVIKHIWRLLWDSERVSFVT